MAICVAFDNSGRLEQSVQSVDDCTGYILVSPTEYNVMLETVEITPEEIFLVFGTVFAWVVFVGFLSWQVKIGRRTINKC